jgi:hypothetical protein
MKIDNIGCVGFDGFSCVPTSSTHPLQTVSFPPTGFPHEDAEQ